MNAGSKEYVVESVGVSKYYGRRPALQDISFRLPEGSFVGIFGPNGAGKTTLLKILATLARPTAGNIMLGGCDLRKQGIQARRQIGLVSHQVLLYEDLTAEENLRFFAKMYDIGDIQPTISKMLEAVGLLHRQHDRVRTFSRGMKQRLTVARALIHGPSLLLLDEPDTGLDLEAGELLEELLSTIRAGGRTTIMATHNFQRGFELCDRFIFLANGKITFDGSKGEMTFEDFGRTYNRHTAGN